MFVKCAKYKQKPMRFRIGFLQVRGDMLDKLIRLTTWTARRAHRNKGHAAAAQVMDAPGGVKTRYGHPSGSHSMYLPQCAIPLQTHALLFTREAVEYARHILVH